jgi:hypothetical protein
VPHYKGRLRKKKKKATYLPTYLFLKFLRFSGSDFRKYVCGVSGLLMRETAKNAIKKIEGERRQEKVFFLSTFSVKSF